MAVCCTGDGVVGMAAPICCNAMIDVIIPGALLFDRCLTKCEKDEIRSDSSFLQYPSWCSTKPLSPPPFSTNHFCPYAYPDTKFRVGLLLGP